MRRSAIQYTDPEVSGETDSSIYYPEHGAIYLPNYTVSHTTMRFSFIMKEFQPVLHQSVYHGIFTVQLD
jgi:hypothetical protein